MKKTGFTLAEVLITLTIIGVVATMTLPALMNNTQEQQAKTAFKKGLNTLTEAVQQHIAIAGWGYGDLNRNSLFTLLEERTQIDYDHSTYPEQETPRVSSGLVDAEGDTNYVVFFRDGSAVSFPRTTTGHAEWYEKQTDGLVYGVPVKYDTNGVKGPNTLSNCEGDTSGTLTEEESTDVSACTKARRVIKDQFGVRLREGFAFPNGTAARWAYED